jgi:hypothetical protein
MNEDDRTTSRVSRQVHSPSSSHSPEHHVSAQSDEYAHLLTILSVSSGMVGVCLTAIGLIGIVKSLSKVETVVDDLLALGTMFFMVAGALSFLGMRTRLGKRWRNLVHALDIIFCLGMLVVVLGAMLLTWVVI